MASARDAENRLIAIAYPAEPGKATAFPFLLEKQNPNPVVTDTGIRSLGSEFSK